MRQKQTILYTYTVSKCYKQYNISSHFFNTLLKVKIENKVLYLNGYFVYMFGLIYSFP